MTITFIGGGNMARAIIGGLIDKGHPVGDLAVADPSEPARQECHHRFGVTVSASLEQSSRADDLLVLAVKPQLIRGVCESLAHQVGQALIVSVAAGARINNLSTWLGGHRRIARAMPNTPALIGMGVAGLVAAPDVNLADRARVEALLRSVGEAVWFDQENDLDAVTALSGSGPAYVFRWIEAMQAAAAQLGLPADKAATLVLHTMRGAAELALRSDLPISTLRTQVTSPGGTTAAGLSAMEEGQIEQVIGNGVRAAHARSIELGRIG